MAKKLGAERSKFLQNMQEYGNTSAASIPILLSESIKMVNFLWTKIIKLSRQVSVAASHGVRSLLILIRLITFKFGYMSDLSRYNIYTFYTLKEK